MRRSVLPCLVLVFLVTAISLPADAGEWSPGGPAGVVSREISNFWEALLARVVPSGWLEKLGPDMDPNGLTAGPCPGGPGGCEAGGGNTLELGPDMDPDG